MSRSPALAPLLLALVSVGSASAAGSAAPATTLRGTVTDASGGALGDAVVQLVELHRQTWSAADGSFAFVRLPAGAYTLIVHRPGFAYASRTVTLPAEEPVALALTESPFTAPPVQVTAARVPRPVLDSPLSTAFLSGSALAEETSVSVSHALERLPGVRTVSTGAEIGKPMIRGLTGARVLVLDDGHRMEDYSWSDEDGPSIDPGLADRIEVIRGPASVLYGSDAIGGVANVLAPELPEADGSAAFTRGAAAAYFGSNSREGGGSLSLEGARGRWGWRAAGTGRFAEALHTPDGELDNTGFSSLTGDAAVGVRGDRGTVSLRYARYGGEFKLLEANGPPPGAPEGPDAGPERKASDDRVQIDGSLVAGTTRFEMKAQFERHSLIEISDEAASPDTIAAPGVVRSAAAEREAFNLLLDTATLDLLAHHRIGSRVSGTAGLSGMLQHNDSRGPIPLVPDASISSGGAFLFEEARLGRWSLLGGVRGDTRSLTADPDPRLGLPAGGRRHWSRASGDLGLVFRPVPRVAVAANAGLAWRAPTLFELYADGPQVADARYLLGRSDLAAERAWNLDGGLRWEGRRVHAEVSAYRNRIDDYIGLYPTGGNAGDLPVWEYRRTDAVLTGMELGASAGIRGPWAVTGRLDFVRGNEAATGAPLPLIPPLRSVVGVAGTWRNLRWARSATAGAEVETVAGKTRLAGHEIGSGGYSLVDLHAGISRRLMGRNFDLSLRVRNAADRRYRDFLSRYKAFADNPGRDIRLRAATGF